MTTRSERYLYEQDETKSRVARNQQLYDSIYAEDTYFEETPKPSAIEKTNEIDIEKVKELLKGREIYRRELKMRELNMVNSETPTSVEKEDLEEKNYDINAYLNKATSDRTVEPYHKIDPEILKEPDDEEEEEVAEPSLADLKEMGTTELSLNMFGDLSATQTIVSEESENDEETEEDDEEEEEEDTTELVATITQTDTFFTDSVKLSETDDDEEDDDSSSSVIKIVMGLLILVIIALVVFVIIM